MINILQATRRFVSSGLLLVWAASASANVYEVSSPDNNIHIVVNTSGQLSWEVRYKQSEVIQPSAIALDLGEAGLLGKAPKVADSSMMTIDQTVTPVVTQKSATIRDHYNQLSVAFAGNYRVEFRAYNDGAAYRFVTTLPGEVIVQDEIMELNFPADTTSLFPEEESLVSHYERLYKPVAVTDIDRKAFASLPVYMEVGNTINVVFTEADLFDYPGMFLYGTGGNKLTAGFAKYVAKATPAPGAEDRNEIIESANYNARTSGGRSFPWRVAVISDNDGDLIESQLVYLLSRENKLDSTDWIKPGTVAWDWYNANNVHGVDFKSGVNTATYKYYIDFAAEYGLDYVILDEGWSKTTTNVKEPNPEINVLELVRYGNKKNVGIILWSLWKPIDQDLENIMRLYADWGVKGVKIDFMQRADQYMVNYYERVAREAAKHRLLVDYHGAYKPAGLRRAYPNVISYEGVKGSENNKWSQDVTPEHNVTLPFIRMVAGPMDYTPGAMANAQLGNHRVVFDRPMSLGTRAHQVAMYIVYESPLQMLCDTPSSYYRDRPIPEFISKIPTVWDETRVLDAKVADYVLIARRKGDVWYLGAMTDWTPRELEVDFSFLPKGKYKIESIQDGINADRFAQDYKKINGTVNNKSVMKIKLAEGGGWAAIVSRR